MPDLSTVEKPTKASSERPSDEKENMDENQPILEVSSWGRTRRVKKEHLAMEELSHHS